MVDISIIVPIYNVEGYLEECIKSIQSQSFFNWELILIDDGSTDNSLNICNSYLSKDQRIKVFHKEKNEGVGAARNTGIQNALGNYLMFVDSDDWLDPDFIQNVYIREPFDYDWIISGYRTIYPNFMKKEYGINSHVFEKENVVNAFIESDLRGVFFTNCGKLYKRIIINQYQLKFDTNANLGEDIIFNINYLFRVSKVITIDYIGYNYRQVYNSNSLINKYNPRLYEQIVSVENYRRLVIQKYKIRNNEYLTSFSRRLDNDVIFAVLNLYKKDALLTRKIRVDEMKKIRQDYKISRHYNGLKSFCIKYLFYFRFFLLLDFFLQLYYKKNRRL